MSEWPVTGREQGEGVVQVSVERWETPNLLNGLPVMSCPFFYAGEQGWEKEQRGGRGTAMKLNQIVNTFN